MSERPSLRVTGPQPADLAAFLAGAEYATLQAPHGSNEDATEALLSAGCYYAPRLLKAVEAVLALAAKYEHGATRWADPLPVPSWIAELRGAITYSLTGEPPELREQDLKVDVFRGASTSVRVTHYPTGLSVAAEGEGSQIELREIAMRELRGMVARKLLGEGE